MEFFTMKPLKNKIKIYNKHVLLQYLTRPKKLKKHRYYTNAIKNIRC